MWAFGARIISSNCPGAGSPCLFSPVSIIHCLWAAWLCPYPRETHELGRSWQPWVSAHDRTPTAGTASPPRRGIWVVHLAFITWLHAVILHHSPHLRQRLQIKTLKLQCKKGRAFWAREGPGKSSNLISKGGKQRQKSSRGLNEGEQRYLISDGINIWWHMIENRIRFHQLCMSLEKGSYRDPEGSFLRTWTWQLKSMCGQYSKRD